LIISLEFPQQARQAKATESTPLERWKMENMKQSPWNNIASIDSINPKGYDEDGPVKDHLIPVNHEDKEWSSLAVECSEA
jgi:hypothetical protein